jgi:transposase
MITDEQKRYIANGYNNKISPNIIAIVLGLKSSSVSSYWCRLKKVEGLPPKIKIRKSKITGSMGIKIKDYISETPKTTNKKILKAANDTISPSKRISRTTLRRFLERNKIVKKKSILKPILSEATKKKRMDFVKKWLKKGKSELGNVIWSDETTVKSHPNTRRESAYVNSSDPALFQPKVHSGGISQMFWGCVSERGTGPLITIDGTMDQILYREVLEKYFIPELRAAEVLGGDWKLMQDNAPCHTARSIKTFLASERIDMVEWPPYSPDMNPIENIWAWMKTKLANDYPISTSADMLAVNFLEIWDSITPEMCARFCGNYEKRLKAVKKAKGGETKY